MTRPVTFVVTHFVYEEVPMMSVSIHETGNWDPKEAYHQSFEVSLPDGPVRMDSEWAKEALISLIEQM